MTPIKMNVDGVEFFRIDPDKNGNPRYVFHWMSLADTYDEAVRLGKNLGAKVYRAKWYGGGLVFNSYSLKLDAFNIRALRKHNEMQKSAHESAHESA